MSDTVALLNDRLAKAEGKVVRFERSLEAARSEVSDIQTTLRILAELSGESTATTPAASVDAATRQSHILSMLPKSRTKAAPPAQLFEAYKLVRSEPNNLEAFRTAVWRLKDKGPYRLDGEEWNVHALDGKYWRVLFREARDPFDEEEEAAAPTAPAAPTPEPNWDDDDVPF